MKRDEKIETVKRMIQSLETNIDYVPFETNHERIKSFTNYSFSRYFDKFSTLGINYIRISWIFDTLRFEQTKSIVKNEKLRQGFLNESDFELITTVLRPLIELYLEIKSIQLSVNAYEDSSKDMLETFCSLIFYETNTTFNELKLNVSKQFYDCEPRYFKLWSDNNKNEVNKLRQQLSQKNIPILKNTKNKFFDVLKHTKNKEKVILGNDYLTTYAIISKKAHFSYSNVITDTVSPKFLTDWCLFYFIVIYEMIMDFVNKTDEIREHLKPFIQDLKNENTIENKESEIGKVLIFDFGIAELLDWSNNKVKIKYLASNVFPTGTDDEVPKIFVKKIIEKQLFSDLKMQFYKSDKELYNDESYLGFYMELMKN